jgi:3-methyladenine DNA glycosylase/8-oxoguanine DNA glycosylase
MLWLGTPLGLKFENVGAVDQPGVVMTIWSREQLRHSFISRLLDEIAYRYGFGLDLTEFNRRFRDDPQLGPAISKWQGMRPLNCSSLYEYLIIAIVLKNATVRRSVNMMQALFTKYGTPLAYDGKRLYCFWEPLVVEAATEDELRALKIGYRAKSVKRVSTAFANHNVDEFELRQRSKKEQRAALLRLYGIGPASAGYILFDVFHRLDEVNHISPWEQKIYSKLFFDQGPTDPIPVDTLLATFNERFGEYKMLAVHYIWEDLFWRRKSESVEWLEQLIRL